MKKHVASSPARIDLAGGTLDIWPLNMLVDQAITVNVAVDLQATAVIEDHPATADPAAIRRVEIRSEDLDREESWEDPASPPADSRLPLVARCAAYFGPERGFRLTTRCASPAGAGLGGSSALAVSLMAAMQGFMGRSMLPPDEAVAVLRDLEAGVLGIPTGTQDHYAAIYGGAAAIRYGPGRPEREPLGIDLEKLGERLVVCYTGASRLSAGSNWDMVKSAIDGAPATRAALSAIATIAREMRAALLAGDLDAAGVLMGREWDERRKLSSKVSTETIEKCIGAARAAGAIAGKVCGAGGGGCVAFLCKDGARDAVERAVARLEADGVSLLRAKPTAVGLQMAG